MTTPTYDRQLMTASLERALELQALIYRHLATEVVRELGDEGRRRLAAALRRYGRWRGEGLAKRLPEDASAQQLAEQWDSADLRLYIQQGYPGGGFRPGGDVAEISVVRAPEWREWQSIEDLALVRTYYVEMLAGIAEGYGSGLLVEHPKFGPDLKSLWTVRFTTPGRPAGRGPLSQAVLDDPGAALALLDATNRNFGALYYFLAKAAMDGPSLSGEKAVRAATRAFGVERASKLRARHEAEGKPVNLKTMMEDYDLPKVSVWRIDDKTARLDENHMYSTCTYCPYAEVWRALPGGLDIGYIYDYEFHLNMYQTYLPGVVAEWDGVMTRGDKVCNFRFRLPQAAEA